MQHCRGYDEEFLSYWALHQLLPVVAPVVDKEKEVKDVAVSLVKLTTLRTQIYALTEQPQSSIFASIFALLSVVCVVTSISCESHEGNLQIH